MRLILIGYRGVGKTATAVELSRQLGWQTVDTDQQVEFETGRPISTIFVEQGEEAFRKLETEALKTAVQRDHVVISTGGGIVLATENRQLLAAAGPVVWLRASVATIQSRLARDQAAVRSRPALLGNDAIAEVPLVLSQRTPMYETVSSLAVDTDSRSPAEVADTIVVWLQSVS